MPQLLIEAIKATGLELVESSNGRLVVRGEFGRCDVPTQNNRVYPRKLYEREIDRLQEDIQARRLLGELDHPADGKTKLQRVSHIITALRIESDGRVYGEAEVLPTPNGNIVAALMRSKVEVGVSSRGFGSTKPMTDGPYEEVAEDFQLKVFDFVADPAMKSAVPDVFAESVQGPVDIEALRADMPEVVAAIEEHLVDAAVEKARKKAEKATAGLVAAEVSRAREEEREQIEHKLAEQLVAVRESVTRDLHEAFAADPKVGGAAAVLAHVAEVIRPFIQETNTDAVAEALRAKDMTIESLKEQRNEFVAIAKRAGYMLHVERRIAGHPRADLVRSLVTKADGFDSLESVDAMVDHIMEELQDMPQPVTRSDVELSRLQALSEKLRSDNASLNQRVERAESAVLKAERRIEEHDARRLDAEKQAQTLQERLKRVELEAYRAEAVAGYANRVRLSEMLESVTSREEVDRLVKTHGRTVMGDGQLERTRAMVFQRAQTRPSTLAEAQQEAQRVDVGGADSDLRSMGLDPQEVARLAGFNG